MIAENPGSRCRDRIRTGATWALLSLVALIVILGVPALPSGAVAVPVAKAPSDSAVQAAQEDDRNDPGVGIDGSNQPKGLTKTMYVIAVGLGLAVALTVACGARIAHERAIRQFRGQLHDANVVALCEPQIVAHQDRAGHQEPPSQTPGFLGGAD